MHAVDETGLIELRCGEAIPACDLKGVDGLL